MDSIGGNRMVGSKNIAGNKMVDGKKTTDSSRMNVRAKLASQRGASVLLALAVVLVCAMVSAVVVAAAAANAGKTASAQDRARAFYAVSSAAQLIVDDMRLEAPSAETSTAVDTYTCQDAHPSYIHEEAGQLVEFGLVFTSTNGASTPIVAMVNEGMYEIDPLDADSTYERSFTISAPDLDDVAATLRMEADYSIHVELQNASSTGPRYAMKVDIASVQADPVVTTQVNPSDIHMDGWEYNEDALTLPWKETTTLNQSTGAYEPESNEFGHATAQTYDVVTTTTTTSLHWGTAAISKGEAV